MGIFKTKKPNLARRALEAGNIFLMLFGAVGMVGVIGAATMTVMKGPVKTMSVVTKRTIAENNMIATGKLALIAAASQSVNDCDGDGTIEPIPWTTALTGLSGGGEIPTTIGAAQQDPWGMKYGYCTWDHGSAIDDAGCGGGAGFLDGNAAENGFIVAIVSAGPDGTFQTDCNDDPATLLDKPSGSDDLTMGYTYAEAGTVAAGLWNLKTSDPDVAEIQKDLEVKNSGGTVVFGVDTGAANPSLEVDYITSLNGTSPVSVLTSIDASDGVNLSGTDSNISLNGNFLSGDGGDEGISIAANGNVSTSHDLSVGGTLSLTNLSVPGNTALGDGVGTDIVTITGDTTMNGLLNTTGAVDFDSTLNVDGNTTLGGTLGVTSNTTIGGNLNVDSTVLAVNAATDAVTMSGTLSTVGAVDFDSTLNVDGNTTLGADVTVTGATTLNGNVTLGDAGADIITANSNIVMGGNEITGLPNPPTAATHATSKAYVDAAVGGATDSRLQNLVANNFCQVDGTASNVNCNLATLPETDPIIGTKNNTEFCRYNSTTSKVECDQTAADIVGGGGAVDELDDLTDALADDTVEHNLIVGRPSAAALFAGAQYNTFIGENAGATSVNSTATTDYNTAIGYNAAPNLTSGHSNVAIGRSALQYTASGHSNVAIGYALRFNLTGQNNIALGSQALDRTTGNQNVGIGSQTLVNNTGGSGNVAIGASAGGNSLGTDGNMLQNTLLGSRAGSYLEGGANYNTLVGYQAGDVLTTGDQNIIIGRNIDPSAATASNELNIGDILFGSGVGTTAGSKVGAVEFCDETLTDCFDPSTIASGTIDELDDLSDALKNTTDNNLFIAHEGGAVGTNNIFNTAIGINALDALTNSAGADEGDENTALGYNALTNNTTGGFNTAIGSSVLQNNTTGFDNLAIAPFALRDNITGTRNVAIGIQAMQANVAKGRNVAIGPSAMRNANNDNTVENTYNTAVGNEALRGSSTAADNTGIRNTAIGADTLVNQTSGSNNVALGFQAGNVLTTGSDNIIIGYDVDPSSATASNELNIGDLIKGDLGATSGDPKIGVPKYCDENLTNCFVATDVGGGTSGSLEDSDGDTLIDVETAATDDDTIRFDTDGTERMVINETGSIGIGDFSSDTIESKLHIAEGFIRLDGGVGNQAGCIRYNDTVDRMQFSHNCSTFAIMGDVAPGSIEIDDLSDALTVYDLVNPEHSNIYIGLEPAGLGANDTGNTIIGRSALDAVNNGGAINNTVVGFNGLTSNTSGDGNIALGWNTLRENTSGSDNIALGTLSLYDNIDGNDNIAIGTQALEGISSGSNNIGIGDLVGSNVSTGSDNILIGNGVNAPDGNSAVGNVNIGNLIYGNITNNEIFLDAPATAPADASLANGQISFWVDAANDEIELKAKDSAGDIVNVTVGAGGVNEINDLSDALKNTTDNNLFIGHDGGLAGANNTFNTAIGINTLTSLTNSAGANEGDNNTAIGYNALNANTTGHRNTGLGVLALSSNTEGNNNTALGASTLYFNTTGSFNTAIGDTALRSNVTAQGNVAVGYAAANKTTSGHNVAIGNSALSENTTGFANTAIGASAFENNTEGSFNTGIGYQTAGRVGVTNGILQGNTLLGYRAGYNFEGGATSGAGADNNVLLGYRAGDLLTTGSDNIIIGYNVDPSSATASNELNIGDTIFGDLDDGDIYLGDTRTKQTLPLSGTRYQLYSDSGNNADLIIGHSNNVVGSKADIDFFKSRGTISAKTALTDGHRTGEIRWSGYDGDSFETSLRMDAIVNGTVTDGNVPMDLRILTSGGAERMRIASNGNIGVGNFASDVIDSTLHIASGDIRLDGGAGNEAGCIRFDDTTNKMQFSNDCSSFTDMDAGGGGGGSEINDLDDGYSNLTNDNLILARASAAALTSGADENVFIGRNAGATSANSTADTDRNVAVGVNALRYLTSGDNNTAFGYSALQETAAGHKNIGIGSDAMLRNDGLSNSIAIGWRTMYCANNTTAGGIASNIAIGVGALYGNDCTPASNTGTYNVAIGEEALHSGRAGGNNVGIGHQSIFTLKDGDDNIALGIRSAYALRDGNNNVVIGKDAGDNIRDGSDNIVIGFSADTSAQDADNELNIGNTLYGYLNDDRIGIGQYPAAGVELDVLGDIEYTGTITDVSDRRLKTDIKPLSDIGSALELITQVDTYSFKMKENKDGKTEFGVMAQDLEKIFPTLVHTADDEIKTKSVNYTGLAAPIIEAIKEIKGLIDMLVDRVAKLFDIVTKLQQENKSLKAEVDSLKLQNDDIIKRLEALEADNNSQTKQ